MKESDECNKCGDEDDDTYPKCASNEGVDNGKDNGKDNG